MEARTRSLIPARRKTKEKEGVVIDGLVSRKYPRGKIAQEGSHVESMEDGQKPIFLCDRVIMRHFEGKGRAERKQDETMWR